MKMPRQHKKNTREEREIIQNAFMECRHSFLDDYDKHHKIIEDNFPLYAVDKTQVPCLLTMDIITNSKGHMGRIRWLETSSWIRSY
jgi:hypothetical protein